MAENYKAQGRIDRLSVLCIDAYGVAVKHGFKGTVEEWLESLKGKSAYEYAKDGGYEGTEEEFTNMVASLKDSSGDFLVTVSGVSMKEVEAEPQYVADKTFAEVSSAVEAGKNVRARVSVQAGLWHYLTLSIFNPGVGCTFHCPLVQMFLYLNADGTIDLE